jgi:hypothetical protein
MRSRLVVGGTTPSAKPQLLCRVKAPNDAQDAQANDPHAG